MFGRIRSAEGMARGLMLAAFACAMLLRFAIPAGWMPVADGSGIRLTICTGMGPMDPAAMAGMAGGRHGLPMPGHGHADGDHPCTFAGLAAALVEPLLPPLPAPSAGAAMPRKPAADLVGVGRGLAAPPPPATGPPLLA